MTSENTGYRFREEKDATPQERSYQEELERYFATSVGSNVEKLRNFTKYSTRQSLTQFISRYEIFKRVLHVQGSIVECGVLFGGGLMAFAQLSAILEPVNNQRKVIGFDTFSGFPDLHEADRVGLSAHLRPSGFAVDTFDDLKEAVRLFDANRFLGHIPKVKLIRGDARETIPRYLEENPHTIVSLLYLDFDIYEPTKVALEHFLPRIPRGGIVVFDELNAENWPGETAAVLEMVEISKLRLERFPFDSYVSFAVVD